MKKPHRLRKTTKSMNNNGFVKHSQSPLLNCTNRLNFSKDVVFCDKFQTRIDKPYLCYCNIHIKEEK